MSINLRRVKVELFLMLRAQAWWSCSFKRSWLHGFTLAFDVCFLGSKVKTWCRSSRGPHSNELCIKHHFLKSPTRSSSYFFLLLCEDRKRKAKGNCFCIVDVPLRILQLKSWGERIFFLPATLTKEYQMKVGRKTATKSPNGTRSVLYVSLIFCLLQYFKIQGHIIFLAKFRYF